MRMSLYLKCSGNSIIFGKNELCRSIFLVQSSLEITINKTVLQRDRGATGTTLATLCGGGPS